MILKKKYIHCKYEIDERKKYYFVCTAKDLFEYLATEESDEEYDEDYEGPIYCVTYTNRDGDTNDFRIACLHESEQYGCEYIDAYCIDKDGQEEDIERTFKISRFKSIEEECI